MNSLHGWNVGFYWIHKMWEGSVLCVDKKCTRTGYKRGNDWRIQTTPYLHYLGTHTEISINGQKGGKDWQLQTTSFEDPVDEELVQVGNSIYGDVRSSSSSPVDALLIFVNEWTRLDQNLRLYTWTWPTQIESQWLSKLRPAVFARPALRCLSSVDVI